MTVNHPALSVPDEDTNAIHVDPTFTDRLAPGVRGYTVDVDGALYIPIIEADTPGIGDVSRYLDSLPRDRTVKVPCVISDRLRDMLARRSFVPSQEWSAEHGEHVEVFVREPVPEVVAAELTWLRRALAHVRSEYQRTDEYRRRLESLQTAQVEVVEAAESLLAKRTPRGGNDSRVRLREGLRDLHRLETA
jgi:hypothetical protein